MIESVQFRNFKVLRNATLPLGRVTLLVGPNGSGKSTALQALRIADHPDQYRYDQVVTFGLASTDEVAVIINWQGGTDTTIRWVATNPPRIARKFNLEEDSDDRSTKARWLKGIRVYSLDPEAITMPLQFTPRPELKPNGGNLVLVLDRLRDQNPERFEELNKILRQWLPEFDRILFDTADTGHRTFLLRTAASHHKIPAVDLSQGALFSLAILTLAYLPDPPPIVCVEEPDRGIHPRLLRDVQDALYRLSYPESYGEEREPVQVIATTHSPYLLDLYRDHPEEVVIAQKIGQEAHFERLSDRPDLDEILRDSQLGEIWYTGILGGVPLQP